MECYLIKKSTTEEIHNKYGTYIFDAINKPACIKHIDGKKKILLFYKLVFKIYK